jgi:hypothetical protein
MLTVPQLVKKFPAVIKISHDSRIPVTYFSCHCLTLPCILFVCVFHRNKCIAVVCLVVSQITWLTVSLQFMLFPYQAIWSNIQQITVAFISFRYTPSIVPCTFRLFHNTQRGPGVAQSVEWLSRDFLFATASRPALGLSRLLSNGHRDYFSGGKAGGAWRWTLTSI